MIKQIIFYILFYIYEIREIIYYVDKKFLDINTNPNAELAVLHSITGKPPTQKRKPAYSEISKRFKKTVESFTPANIQFYCRALGHLNYMQWIYVFN